jgi:hypothetical protein
LDFQDRKQELFHSLSKTGTDINAYPFISNSDVGNYDRVVIQDLLKEVAQTQQVDAAAQKRFKGAHALLASYITL